MTAIETQNLSRHFGEFIAVDQLNLSIPKGHIFGFLGPNGSGKSTTIRMLSGILAITSGQAQVLDINVAKHPEKVRPKIGYMSQRFSLYEDLSVEENISFFSSIYRVRGKEAEQRKAYLKSLTGIAGREKQIAGQLSGGWKQRLGLTCALLHNPDLIFLDEPTAGIDPVARRELWNLLFTLASEGKTIFVSTHYMDEAERCNQIAYIYLSRLIVNGSPSEIKKRFSKTQADKQNIEIQCSPIMKAYHVLKQASFIHDLTFFGEALHGIVNQNMDFNTLKESLLSEDIHGIKIRPISPSLEDIFIQLTRQIDQGQHVL